MQRVPQPYENIQVNHCKTPTCPNYGVSASPHVQSRGRHMKADQRDGYVRTSDKGFPHLRCLYCGVRFPVKSNKGVYEEKIRSSHSPPPVPEPSCQNQQCANYGKSVKCHEDLYYRWTKTKLGARRYMCKGCRKTFSIPRTTLEKQQRPEINDYVFKSLCNRNSISGMAEIFDCSRDTIGHRIDFFYEQCVKFIEKQEAKLVTWEPWTERKEKKKLYISVDRQFYTINWELYTDRRNSILYGLAAADNKSGYVFAMDANYEPLNNYDDLEREVIAAADYSESIPFRQHARFWLKQDFEELHEAAKMKAKEAQTKNMKRTRAPFYPTEEAERYEDHRKRVDIECPDLFTESVKLPRCGVLVRGDYHLYGFFQRLRELVGGATKLRFFMDQEPGIRAACMSAFQKEIRDRTCDAFYVQIARGLRRKDREDEENNAKAKQEAIQTARGLTSSEARLLMLTENLNRMREAGVYGDEWFEHPLPTRNEPRKKICYLTDFNDYVGPGQENHLPWLYNKASLHGVNSYFNNIRMKMAAFSRGIVSATSPDKIWTPFSPYDPSRVHKLLLIHRVYYNFARRRNLPGGETPAMQLGLIDYAVEVDEILSGKAMSPRIRQNLAKKITRARQIDFLNGPEPADRGDAPYHFHPLRQPAKQSPHFVYLDTETTGTNYRDKIVEIAIVDDKGNALINTLINPVIPIPRHATRLHGITNAMIQNMPEICDIEDQIADAVRGSYVIIYNARFDMMFLSDRIRDAMKGAVCCKERLDKFNAEVNYFGGISGASLIRAAAAINYTWQGNPHRALSDALATRAVWQYLMRRPKRNRRVQPAFTGP
jgi:DNA polymerase III epsilon subunit-like protein